MSVPDLIPIRWEPHHRTATIGRWERGQFFAHVSGVFEGREDGDAGRVVRRWYAVLHEFDEAGRHIDSTIEAVGTVPDGPEKASVAAAALQLLDEWLDALPGREFGDIEIAPFAMEVDGTLFGLIRECHGEYPDGEEQEDWAEFYPNRLGFSAPWDGSYDT
jgi:formate hydrogenlyase regulatory protein HycA